MCGSIRTTHVVTACVCVRARDRERVCVYVYVCVYMCMCVCVCMSMYVWVAFLLNNFVWAAIYSASSVLFPTAEGILTLTNST